MTRGLITDGLPATSSSIAAHNPSSHTKDPASAGFLLPVINYRLSIGGLHMLEEYEGFIGVGEGIGAEEISVETI